METLKKQTDGQDAQRDSLFSKEPKLYAKGLFTVHK